MQTELLLSVWREACRHWELPESVGRVFEHLANALPLSALLLRRLDLEHSALETAAASGVRPTADLRGRTVLTPVQLKQLLAWHAKGGVLRRALVKHGTLGEALWPVEAPIDALAGPLKDTSGPGGVLLLLAQPGADFSTADETLAAELLEPFAVALENDRRLHEITALRAAAEADREALLHRLGRKDVKTERIVGAEAGLRHVLERVDLVAGSDVPVLILGETGSGKEVVARAIHTRSPRSAGPFIRVNCGAIPPELIDSQLFGHERGSFTGAVETHEGWFERADRGTLFLDEIGELPTAAQVRLLRVLQDGLVERVGAKRSLVVDVRIVAATHRDLPAMVRAGSFREDLWYRINAFPIPLPALRERPEDIAALACHFAEKAATRFGLTLVMPTPEDLRLLCAYDWPGNVRELATVIDRAALLGNGRCLEVAKALGVSAALGAANGRPPALAPPAPRAARPQTDAPAPTPRESGALLQPSAAATPSLDEVMRAHIEAALAATLGRIEGPFGAARRLNINPHTLRARMRKLQINWRQFRPPRGA